MCDILSWMDKHSGITGYAQGMGSLLAVAVAIWVPWKIKSNDLAREDAEKQLRGKSLAAVLLGYVEGVRRESEKKKATFERSRDSFIISEENAIPLPEFIEYHVEDLHFLGREACEWVQGLLFYLHDYDMALQSDGGNPDTDLMITAVSKVFEAAVQAKAALLSVAAPQKHEGEK